MGFSLEITNVDAPAKLYNYLYSSNDMSQVREVWVGMKCLHVLPVCNVHIQILWIDILCLQAKKSV
jgi:hypothetical protein